MTDDLAGDDFTADDVAAMLRRFADRPREHPPRPPTLADSNELHKLADQHVPYTQESITEDGVTIEQGTIYMGRPVLGELQEEADDD
jgi:hypothetical protein